LNNVLVVAAHPDDETLGCGGTLLKHISDGDSVHWLIVTAATLETGYTSAQIDARAKEIKSVAKSYKFASVNQFGFDSARLDTVARKQIIEKLAEIIDKIKPQIVYLPFPGDVHSDHRIVFECATAATKNFRAPYIRKTLTCEVLSETKFGIDPSGLSFRPNYFVDISGHIEDKIRILNFYKSEMGDFPFPRSQRAVRALASLRGAQSSTDSAEAFMIVSEFSR
jgi:LmbE family N-acetylglucosaminyl deacetylase